MAKTSVNTIIATVELFQKPTKLQNINSMQGFGLLKSASFTPTDLAVLNKLGFLNIVNLEDNNVWLYNTTNNKAIRKNGKPNNWAVLDFSKAETAIHILENYDILMFLGGMEH